MVIRFLTVMMKHGYIGEFEVCRKLNEKILLSDKLDSVTPASV